MTKPIRLKAEDEQFDALYVAMANIGKLRGEPNPRDKWVREKVRPYGESMAKWLGVLNPWANELWADYLKKPPYPKQTLDHRLFCVSLLSHAWQIDLQIPRSAPQLHQEVMSIVPKLKQGVRNKFTELPDFLLMIDVALHVVDKRRSLCLHAHGFVWGEEKFIQKIVDKFPPVIGGARGGDVKPCKDRRRWSLYMAKDARQKTVTNRIANDAKERPRYFKGREVLTKEDQLILVEAIGDLTKPEMTFASGEGSKILRAAKKAALENDYEIPNRSLQP